MLLNTLRLLPALVAVAALTAVSGPASGHHSFAMFDNTKEVTLEGTVKEFQWKNPHSFIQLMVKDGGKEVEWSLEGGSPNIMGRNGWKRTSLAVGEKVKILIHPLRDGRAGGTFLEVHKTNGEVLYYHG